MTLRCGQAGLTHRRFTPRQLAARNVVRDADRELRAWRRDLDGWLGYVGYGVSPGLRYLEWVEAERVRPV
jgi:hypothetical protein